ncbi:hypothetical protein BX600DRAFT_355719, partial [Xylariales sp. PMI_506]
GPSAAANCRVLERIHRRAADWATRYGCSFNPDKYELMHFKTDKSSITSKDHPIGECLNLPGREPLPPVNQLRHLGVWLDPALTWNHHITEISKKVRKSIQALKTLVGSDWGCGTLQLRQLYQSIIVP